MTYATIKEAWADSVETYNLPKTGEPEPEPEKLIEGTWGVKILNKKLEITIKKNKVNVDLNGINFKITDKPPHRIDGGVCQWMMGYPDETLKEIDSIIQELKKIKDIHVQNNGIICFDLGDDKIYGHYIKREKPKISPLRQARMKLENEYKKEQKQKKEKERLKKELLEKHKRELEQFEEEYPKTVKMGNNTIVFNSPGCDGELIDEIDCGCDCGDSDYEYCCDSDCG